MKLLRAVRTKELYEINEIYANGGDLSGCGVGVRGLITCDDLFKVEIKHAAVLEGSMICYQPTW
jgi:hypothetical protein